MLRFETESIEEASKKLCEIMNNYKEFDIEHINKEIKALDKKVSDFSGSVSPSEKFLTFMIIDRLKEIKKAIDSQDIKAKVGDLLHEYRSLGPDELDAKIADMEARHKNYQLGFQDVREYVLNKMLLDGLKIIKE